MRWRGLPVTLRRTDTARLDDVLAVLDEVTDRLALAGVRQWPRRFPPEWVRPAIEGGHTWLADVAGEPAATLTLTWSDPLWEDDRAAGYLHRLAVRRHVAGLGACLLRWAAGEVERRDRRLLRLDCVAHNRRLRDYYESHGFAHRGDVEVGGAQRVLLSRYEVSVACLRGRYHRR